MCYVQMTDIKPDNIIITGADLELDECWSDDKKAEKLANSNHWNAILIDFGFARHVFGEKEIAGSKMKTTTIKKKKKTYRDGASGLSISNHRRKVLDETISKKTILDLSAVGNRTYAAPEIFKTIHKYSAQGTNVSSSSSSSSSSNGNQEYPLAEYVSNYGMVADAYSVGMTIRYLITGVPASESNIDEYIAMQNHPFLTVSRNLKKLMQRSKKTGVTKTRNQPRKKNFRSNDVIPKDVKSLIFGLTRNKQQDRTTVRAAKYHSWLAAENVASC